VGDKTYASQRTAFGTTSCAHSKEEAIDTLANHPLQTTVDVIYKPTDPNYAALRMSDDSGAFWWFLNFSGAVFLFCSLVGFSSYFKKHNH
jgi:hypothetical protein